jgi:uncharacterized membrane protein YkoI
MRTSAAACLLAVAGLVSTGQAVAGVRADGAYRHGAAPDASAAAGSAAVRAGGMSLDQAVAMVQRRYNAKVVRAEETREGEDVVYRIRLLSGDGRVFTVRVNARTGQMD